MTLFAKNHIVTVRLGSEYTSVIINLITTHNQFHNILRLFDVLPNFPFATSETMEDYYL